MTCNITATPNNAATQVVFKNCATLEKCRTERNETFIDEATHINITMPMYNLIEYSDNYSDTSGSLWHFKRDEMTNNADVTNDDNHLHLNIKQVLLVIQEVMEKNGIKIAIPSRCFLEIIRNAIN